MKLLTPIMAAAMLSLLSQKTKAGIGTPNQGHYRPLSNVVFLCPSKTQAALCRRASVMAGCIGQTLKQGLAGSLAGSSNLMQLAAQRLEPKGGGLSLYQGVTAMRHYAQNPAKSSQTNTAQVLFKHRFDIADIGNQIDVVDAINQMTDRASSILLLLSGQFEGEENRLSDRIIAEAIYAVINEVKDINDVINAHRKATCNKASGGAE